MRKIKNSSEYVLLYKKKEKNIDQKRISLEKSKTQEIPGKLTLNQFTDDVFHDLKNKRTYDFVIKQKLNSII